MINPDVEKRVDPAKALAPWFSRKPVYIVPEDQQVTVALGQGEYLPVYSYNGHNGTGEITHYNLRSGIDGILSGKPAIARTVIIALHDLISAREISPTTVSLLGKETVITVAELALSEITNKKDKEFFLGNDMPMAAIRRHNPKPYITILEELLGQVRPTSKLETVSNNGNHPKEIVEDRNNSPKTGDADSLKLYKQEVEIRFLLNEASKEAPYSTRFKNWLSELFKWKRVIIEYDGNAIPTLVGEAAPEINDNTEYRFEALTLLFNLSLHVLGARDLSTTETELLSLIDQQIIGFEPMMPNAS